MGRVVEDRQPGRHVHDRPVRPRREPRLPDRRDGPRHPVRLRLPQPPDRHDPARTAAWSAREYDGGGRVVGQTDANGNTTTYTYDKLGRKLTETLPDPDGAALTAATTTSPPTTTPTTSST